MKIAQTTPWKLDIQVDLSKLNYITIDESEDDDNSDDHVKIIVRLKPGRAEAGAEICLARNEKIRGVAM